ncbi:MAG: ATP-binding protein [Christensenellales bacterium]
MIHSVYPVERGAYENAGQSSADIKRQLKQLGVDSTVIRRVAIASYEAEMNLIIHSLGGAIELDIDGSWIVLQVYDRGPGIPDVELAKQEGYSTAGEDARGLGFGAGMGLPNMMRNTDDFLIASQVGVGTLMVMKFHLQ